MPAVPMQHTPDILAAPRNNEGFFVVTLAAALISVRCVAGAGWYRNNSESDSECPKQSAPTRSKSA
jgi:hypothetical protein